MAKKKQTDESAVDVNETGETVETGDEGKPAAKGGRHIMIADPDNNGEMIRRVDFCRREVMEKGRGRGEVAKQLTEIEGRDVKFQIVYAATKDYRAPKAVKAETAETAEDGVISARN